jgi:hypothetical protein
MTLLRPKVGQWYHDDEQNLTFEIVAIDHKYIEVQYQDGEIEEYDLESWRELYLTPVEAADDWRNPLGLSSEDLHSDDDIIHPDDPSNPLSLMEPDVEIDFDDY